MTESQQRALNELWPSYGIHFRDELLDLDLVFGRSAGRVLEIGFGNGDTLVDAAAEHPEQDFIGIEVHEPGVGHCLIRAREAGIGNLRIIDHDAIEVLQRQIPDGSISRINLLFPDPWPKKRHHKRRIVQPAFLELAARKLCAGGALFIATDWADYAGHIDDVLRADSHFAIADNREHAGDQALDRQTTKFEARGLRKGHRIRDWHCIKT